MSVLFDEQVMDHAQAHLEVVFAGLVLKRLNVKILVKLAWNWKWLVTHSQGLPSILTKILLMIPLHARCISLLASVSDDALDSTHMRGS